MNWEMVWTILGVTLSMFTIFSGLMFWIMSRMENRIHADISTLTTRLDTNMASSDAKWVAMSNRIDGMNARIDITQAIIMRMLEKQGK